MSVKTDMEKELIPKSSNITSNKGLHKKRTKREKKVKVSSGNGIEKHRYSGGINPFEDAKRFVAYYHSYMSLHSAKTPVFDSIDTDCMVAGHILDDIIEIGRVGDKKFLDAWIDDFMDRKLKGAKIQKSKYTTLRELRPTLKKFNNEVFRSVSA